MVLERFISATSLAHWNIFESKGNPYEPNEYMAKVDEVLNAFNNIDSTALEAELIDGVNNEQEMSFRVKVIKAKLKDTDALYFYDGKPLFTDEQEKKINEVMGDDAYTYKKKWYDVTEIWHNLSCTIIDNYLKLKELSTPKDKEPQQCRTSKEQDSNETMEQWIQRKFDEVKDDAINWHLIEKDGDGWKWKLNLSMYAYFWSSLLCGDYIKDCGDNRLHWVWDRRKPLTMYENTIISIIPIKSKRTLQEIRAKGANEYERCKNYHLVDRVIKGGL